MKRSPKGRHRQTAAVLLSLALAACSMNPFASKENESQRGTVGFVRGFLGGIAVDEPRAALIGREILSTGGTAADAAVAAYFALAVTLPSSASLGGGGICVVHDAKSRKTETLDFLPAIPKRIPPKAARPTAVPGNVRGFAMLHAKYGRLPWAQVVSPGEKLARFGDRVSRAFASDLRRMAPALVADPEIRRIFGRSGTGGGLAREQDFYKQVDLSAVLGSLRASGAGDFYNGPLARQLVAAAAKAGGSISIEDLRSYTPRWRPTLTVPYIKNTKFHFPMPPGPSGVLAAQMMGMLIENGDWEDASAAERAHLIAEITGRVFASRGQWFRNDGSSAIEPTALVSKASIERLLAGFRPDRHVGSAKAGTMPVERPDSPAGTGFVVVDREGSAVACSLTLNNLFGTGRIATGMGIFLAALPGPRSRGLDSLAVGLLIGELHNVFYFAVGASGGVAAPSAMVTVATRAIMGRPEENLEMALAAKRIHNSGIPDHTYYEQGLDDAVVDSLAKRGHRLKPVPAMGLVNAILCNGGIPNEKIMSCSIRSDPRGFGLASGSE